MDGSGHSVCMPCVHADGAAVYLEYYRGMSGKLRCWLAGRFLHVQEVMNCLYGTLYDIETIIKDFLNSIGSDKLYMDTPPELEGLSNRK